MKRTPTACAVLALSVLQAQQPDTTIIRIAGEHARKKECREADRLLAPLLQREPPLSDAVLIRASCRIRSGEQVQEHMHALQEVLNREPHHFKVLLYRGDLYNDLRMFDRAEADLDLAVEHAPDTASLIEALNRRAWNSLQSRKHASAKADCERALAMDSVSQTALNNMALAASELGDTATAFRMLKAMIHLDPKSTAGWINTGYFLGTCGRHAEALTYYAEAEKLGRKDSRLLSNRGFSKLGVGDIKGARKDVEQSIALDGNNPYAYRNLAHIELAARNTKAACTAMERALALGFTRMYGNEMIDLRRTHCN
ncbi:MAG: hypothetical protein IPM46_05660 [Flavobacteriales bacterium]|nr:hypothetical protein [Flavobacteriales bacterium]